MNACVKLWSSALALVGVAMGCAATGVDAPVEPAIRNGKSLNRLYSPPRIYCHSLEELYERLNGMQERGEPLPDCLEVGMPFDVMAAIISDDSEPLWIMGDHGKAYGYDVFLDSYAVDVYGWWGKTGVSYLMHLDGDGVVKSWQDTDEVFAAFWAAGIPTHMETGMANYIYVPRECLGLAQELAAELIASGLELTIIEPEED